LKELKGFAPVGILAPVKKEEVSQGGKMGSWFIPLKRDELLKFILTSKLINEKYPFKINVPIFFAFAWRCSVPPHWGGFPEATIPLFHGRGKNSSLPKIPLFSIGCRNSETKRLVAAFCKFSQSHKKKEVIV